MNNHLIQNILNILDVFYEYNLNLPIITLLDLEKYSEKELYLLQDVLVGMCELFSFVDERIFDKGYDRGYEDGFQDGAEEQKKTNEEFTKLIKDSFVQEKFESQEVYKTAFRTGFQQGKKIGSEIGVVIGQNKKLDEKLEYQLKRTKEMAYQDAFNKAYDDTMNFNQRVDSEKLKEIFEDFDSQEVLFTDE